MTDQTQQAAASIYVVRDMEGRIVDAHDSEPDMTAYHGSCALYVYPAAPAVGAPVQEEEAVAWDAGFAAGLKHARATPAASLREQESKEPNDAFWDDVFSMAKADDSPPSPRASARREILHRSE